jgi:hypothetical protein
MLVLASGVYIFALIVHWRQCEQGTHDLYFAFGRLIAAYRLGQTMRIPPQGIVVDFMPWFLLVGMVASLVYHAVVRRASERR